MTSYWDKVERQQKTAVSHGTTLRDLQTELWGWCDMRQRDNIRTARSGWAGNLLNPPLDRRGRRHGMIYSTVVDDVERQGQSGFEEQAKTAAERRAEDERDEVKTVAELAAYVSGAWDSGGASYCATKTWYGSGLGDALERLAAQLSPAERRAAEQNMRAALPPCRNCGCQQTELKSVA